MKKQKNKATKKISIIKLISIILMILGVSIIISIQLSNIFCKETVSSQINEFKQLRNSLLNDKNNNGNYYSDDNDNSKKATNNNAVSYKIDLDKLYTDSINYNKNLVAHQRELLKDTSYEIPALNLINYGIPNNIYGYISAPSIGMELPIFLGANEQNMSYGATHMTYTSLPIGGKSTNCVISAHSGYIGKLFFDNIVNLALGDKVSVTNYWSTLTYEVKDLKILKDYQSGDCYIKSNKDMLTLITCISDNKGGFNRYYVICERC